MNNMKVTDTEKANIMLDMPHGFTTGNRHFFIYPPSLGVSHLTGQIMQKLDINEKLLKRNAVLELLRVAQTKRRLCCLLLAYNTLRDKNDILGQRLEEHARYFEKELPTEDLATLLTQILCAPSIKDLIKAHNIDEDSQLRERVQNAKSNNNTYVFGGKSLYGALIGAACEKFHWTYDYVVWGISYANLQLMMADAVTTMYLTDDERKNNFIPAPGKKVKVTAENIADIKRRYK